MQFNGHHQFEEVSAVNDPPIGILKNPRLVSKVAQAVAEVVGQHAKNGQLPVTIGGDHSLVRMHSSGRAAKESTLTICAYIQAMGTISGTLR